MFEELERIASDIKNNIPPDVSPELMERARQIVAQPSRKPTREQIYRIAEREVEVGCDIDDWLNHRDTT